MVKTHIGDDQTFNKRKNSYPHKMIFSNCYVLRACLIVIVMMFIILPCLHLLSCMSLSFVMYGTFIYVFGCLSSFTATSSETLDPSPVPRDFNTDPHAEPSRCS